MPLDPTNIVSMNNLAWILATEENDNIQLKRTLYLVEHAVAINRSDIFLDTLAEVSFKMDRKNDTVSLIKEAIAMNTSSVEYYRKQLKKINSFR